jgi:hypothetical protein
MAGAQMAAQGSQMIGQGLANLGQEVGKGVEEYYKKKEKTELKNRAITTFQSLGKANPEFIRMLGIKDIEDTGVVGAVVESLGGPANALQLGKTLNDVSTQRQATALGNLYTRAGNTNLSPIDKQFNPIEYSPESQRMAQNQFMADTTTRLQQDKLRSEIALDKANAKKAETPMQAKPPVGYEYTPTGGLQPTAGGPADVTTAGTPAQIAAAGAARAAVTQDLLINKQAEATRLQTKKFLGAAEARKTELETTLDFVKKARALSRKNVGGPIGGYIGMFGKENQKLAGYLDTIKSNLRLNKMAELKALSPSGATGFGSQTEKEGAVMESYLGTLSQYQPEELTQENLDVIETYINKQLRSYNPKEALIAPVSDEAIFQEFGLK